MTCAYSTTFPPYLASDPTSLVIQIGIAAEWSLPVVLTNNDIKLDTVELKSDDPEIL